ncbi:MAG: protein kinase [Myxococcales bacterium]|nr:protein kinase [Myxococcales bacterium]
MSNYSPSRPRGGPSEFVGSERYELVRKLGQGGFGVVFEAIDRELGGRVALKALQRITADSLFGLKQEFRALADVSHPNLVALYELAEHDGHWFFTMEYLDGTDFFSHVRPSDRERPKEELLATVALADVASDESVSGTTSARAYARGSSSNTRRLDLARLRAALPQLVEGVMGLHQLGMLHRDVKPSNVMVTRGGRVVLLDFGLVRPPSTNEPISGRVRLDAPPGQPPTAIVGTPEYMSPEQSVGDPLTPASDWYAVGTVLYEALCGRRPFVGTVAEIVADRQYSDPPRPSELVDDVPNDLEELVMALLRRDPTRRPTGSQVARSVGAQGTHSLSSAVTGSELLVGRDEALATLRAAFDECVTTKPARPIVVEVYGSSGVGKSALVGKFLDELRKAHGALVLTGRCDERKSVPFKALDGVVDALSVFLRNRAHEELSVLVPRRMDALEQLFPVLAFDPSTGRARSTSSYPPPASRSSIEPLTPPREAAFAALRDLLVRASALRPVVIAVDDLQWGDDDSAALLREVLTGPDTPNVLFIATLRGEPGQVRTPFDSVEGAALDRRVVDVRPLGERDALALARALLGRRADSEHEAHRIAREAGGNPFFVGELARFALERGASTEHEPLSLERVVLERVRGLPDDARSLLELVAVIGQPVPQRVIFDASSLGDRAYPALRALRASNMVRIAGAKEADSVEPYHDRIRESVVESLPKHTLRARHASIARALEARTDSDPGLLAEHLFGAGERERAAAQALAAAQLADRSLAFERAARWYRAALDWGEARGVERSELLARMAHTLASCGRNGSAAEAFLEAAELSDGRTRSIELRRHAGVQFFTDGRHDDGVRTLSAVAKELGVSIPESPWLLGAGLAKDTAWLRVRGTRFRETPASRIDSDTLQRLDLFHHAGLGSAFADSLLSMWYLTRFTRMAIEVGEPVRVGLALLRYSTTLSVFGPAYEARALDILRQAEDLSIRHRDPYLRGCIDMGYGFLDLMMGRWTQSISRCDRALDVLSKVPGAVWDTDTAASLVTEALTNQGRLSQAFRKAARQERDARERNFIAGMVRNALRWESLRLVMSDERDAARRVLEEASAKIPPSRFLFGHFLEMIGRAQLAAYEGSCRALLPWFRAQWPKLERSMMLSAPVFRVGGFSALASVLLGAARESAPSEQALLLAECDAMGRKLEAEPATHIRARGLATRASAAAIAGRERDALSLYRAALQTFETADMQLHAAASRLAVGTIIGGDEGALLVTQGQRFFVEQGVARADQFAQIFVAQPVSR